MLLWPGSESGVRDSTYKSHVVPFPGVDIAYIPATFAGQLTELSLKTWAVLFCPLYSRGKPKQNAPRLEESGQVCPTRYPRLPLLENTERSVSMLPDRLPQTSRLKATDSLSYQEILWPGVLVLCLGTPGGTWLVAGGSKVVSLTCPSLSRDVWKVLKDSGSQAQPCLLLQALSGSLHLFSPEEELDSSPDGPGTPGKGSHETGNVVAAS